MAGAVPRPAPMSEDERLELLETIGAAHSLLSDATLALSRRLTSKALATKAAVKAERSPARP